MKWPAYFPKYCPPLDAQPAALAVYMLVSSPMMPSDFHSLRLRSPDQYFSAPELLCQAHGLSVFENVHDVNRVRQRVKRLRDQVMAQGQLTAESGVIKPTSSQFGNSHRTWWVVEGIKPWLYFQIARSEG